MYVCTAGKEKSNRDIEDEQEDLRGTFTGVLFFTHMRWIIQVGC
jgi:hypothetical protein